MYYTSAQQNNILTFHKGELIVLRVCVQSTKVITWTKTAADWASLWRSITTAWSEMFGLCYNILVPMFAVQLRNVFTFMASSIDDANISRDKRMKGFIPNLHLPTLESLFFSKAHMILSPFSLYSERRLHIVTHNITHNTAACNLHWFDANSHVVGVLRVQSKRWE